MNRARDRSIARIGAALLGVLVTASVVLGGCASPADEERRSADGAGDAARSSQPADAEPTSTAEPTRSSRETATADPQRAYLAIGDSVTLGIGVADPPEQGYPARLAERLDAAGSAIDEVRVIAVPGETARGFLERHMAGVERAIDRLGDRLELVTIGLGANELLRTRRDPACVADAAGTACQDVVARAGAAAEAALDAVVERVTDALSGSGSEALVLLLAYYNPDVEPIAVRTIVGADGTVGCAAGDPAPGLNDRIACVAERRGVGLVDLHAAFLGRERELTRIDDGDVHPNAAGYDVIADAIAAEIGRAEEPG